MVEAYGNLPQSEAVSVFPQGSKLWVLGPSAEASFTVYKESMGSDLCPLTAWR